MSVKEDSELDTRVIKLSAFDLDLSSNLKYRINEKESKALDENGRRVEFRLVKNWFLINETNGQISTSAKLDREVVEEVLLSVYVEDINAHPDFVSQTQNSNSQMTSFSFFLFQKIFFYIFNVILQLNFFCFFEDSKNSSKKN